MYNSSMKLYNTLSRNVEEFVPLKPGTVGMYVCGITPYDTTHLGHAFTYLSFDVLVRFLESKGYKVTYSQNVTDINDRDNDILQRAKEQGVSWQKVADYWTKRFLQDMKALNWRMPDNYLKASEHMPTMIKLVSALLTKEYAYQAEGSVYLDVTKVKDFGKLSRHSKEKMITVAKDFEEDLNNPRKKHPLDITLWKAKEPNQPAHIPSFGSPFGKGRPGWHIECSSMAICSLSEQIDIHGGGIDLIFPHHESEIAQSESATGKIPFAKFWIHTHPVHYKGEKMSKSKGNLVLVSDLLEKYSPNAIRFLLLSHHYRKGFEYTKNELKKAEETVNVVRRAVSSGSNIKTNEPAFLTQFQHLLENDLNTPDALTFIANNLQKIDKPSLKKMLEILGFDFKKNIL